MTESDTIDLDHMLDIEQVRLVIDTLNDVVLVHGFDFVYSVDSATGNCLYVQDGKPHCLVAQVLARLGVSLDLLASQEGQTVLGLQGTGLRDPAKRVLRAAQIVQDSDMSWGRALNAAYHQAFLYAESVIAKVMGVFRNMSID